MLIYCDHCASFKFSTLASRAQFFYFVHTQVSGLTSGILRAVGPYTVFAAYATPVLHPKGEKAH